MRVVDGEILSEEDISTGEGRSFLPNGMYTHNLGEIYIQREYFTAKIVAVLKQNGHSVVIDYTFIILVTFVF